MTLLETPAASVGHAATRPSRSATPALPGVVDSVLDLVGETPVVRLHRLAAGIDATVLVKLEGRNPGGSAKDRAALSIVRSAEASGALAPGATIVECTSGNTGIGLALVGRLTGHPVVIVHSPHISPEKRALLRAYGAELVEADWELGPEHPDNARAVADRIAASLPGAWRSQQFDNPDNARGHLVGTGPEIWRQTGGAVTHFVAGLGTTGTISGTGRFLKQASAGAVRVVGANPAGSAYGEAPDGPILVEGVGTHWPASHWPGILDRDVVDEVRTVDDARVFALTRRLPLDEGLLVGPSSALAIAVALDVAAEAGHGAVVLAIAPDTGTNYLSTAFDDAWLHENGIPSA